jgi:hypothetical protein
LKWSLKGGAKIQLKYFFSIEAEFTIKYIHGTPP